jgi:hypothetical protein
MAEAAYAAGPALLGAPRRAYSLLCFPKFLFPVSSRGPNSAPVRGPKESKSPRKREAPKSGAQTGFSFPVTVRGPKEPNCPPENARPKNLKSEGPIRPKRFFPVSVFQRGAPKSPRSPDNVSTQNLKIEVPKSGAPNGFFVTCFSAGSKQR